MIDLAALAALFFDASKEWTEPKVARFDVAIARQMFQEILRLIAELRPQPRPALA